ncbi:threonine/serine exporter family protein [Streptomyces sp. NPDC002328]|uniref:threonine/serine exporter family protein n=1 Tax=Streptomyces sp. NPDC002328 TaxID=3364642 RepID=UPI0036B88546
MRAAGLDELTGFLVRLTRLLLNTSGEGAERIEDAVTGSARALGGDARVLLVPDGAALTVTDRGGGTRTVTVRGFPEVFRLDQVTALKPLLADLRAGRLDVTGAERRLTRIEASPPPYPRWAKLLGIVLFSLGFAPLMQPTWYEVASTAALGTIAACLAVAADRVPRLATVLPLVVSTVVSVVTIEVFARSPAHGGPVLLMLPALFFFVPGDYLSAATAELAAGHITTGAIRLVHSGFLLVQLYLGVPLGVFATGASTPAFFDVTADADLLALVYLTVGVQSLVTKLIGETGGTFVAAAVLAATATVLDRAPHRPPRLVLLLPGFFALTVGSLGMRGLTTPAGGHLIQGFADLLKMVTIVTAIAVGMLLGATLAQRPRTDG